MITLNEEQTKRLLKALERCIDDPHVALHDDEALLVLSQYFHFPTKYALLAAGVLDK